MAILGIVALHIIKNSYPKTFSKDLSQKCTLSTHQNLKLTLETLIINTLKFHIYLYSVQKYICNTLKITIHIFIYTMSKK